MNQQKYLDILADIDTTAEELQVKRLPFASRIIKAKRIQDQCRILDDLKIQEGGSAPAPFQPVVIYEWTDNHGGTREKTDLIIIHSTRSGKKRTAGQELNSTRSWFANPESKASAQVVIATNGDIYFFVPADEVSWGATYLNQRAINIELVQARIEIPFTDEQYTSLAWLLKEWTGLLSVPYVRVMDENERGIIGHEDSAQGKSYGKSDPGYMLDWSRIGL